MTWNQEAQVERILLRDYEKYYRLAYLYVGNEQDALDVVQESAYKAIRECKKLQEAQYAGTWLHRIVINTSLDMLRKRGRETALEEQAEPVWEDTYREWDFRQAFARLEQKERTVIILRYFEEMKLEEIARTLGENLNAVKARLYRALKKMRQVMEPEADCKAGERGDAI